MFANSCQPTGVFKIPPPGEEEEEEEEEEDVAPAGPAKGGLPPSRHAVGWAAEAPSAVGSGPGVSGVGLGLGVAAVVAAVAFGYMIARRRGA